MRQSHVVGRAALALVAFGLIGAAAQGAVIQQGLYKLGNHPDGNAQPPQYGARLDELWDVTAGHDIFTFDFDDDAGDPNDNGAAMFLFYDGASIHIYGQAHGGRDTGGGYANDAYLGLYTFDFTYNLGVQLVPGDDDLMVDPPLNQYNYGTVLTPLGTTAWLRDGHYEGAQLDFRFGDEDDDDGHRGFAGLSGWGWLFHAFPGESYLPYTADSDWLFTATLVPAPGSIALFAGAGLFGFRRSRR